MNSERLGVSLVHPTPHYSKTVVVIVHCADVSQTLSLGTGLANCCQPSGRLYSYPPSFFSSSYLRHRSSDGFTNLCHIFFYSTFLGWHLATFLECRSISISLGPTQRLLSAGPGNMSGEQLEVMSLFRVLNE